MRVKKFVGKSIDIDRARSSLFISCHGKGKRVEEFSVAEIYLSDFDCTGNTDKAGYNAYSLNLYLDGERIVKIVRVGHCHMCGGQGSDHGLKRFPHRSLELQTRFSPIW